MTTTTTKRQSRLHPHLEHFIKTVVMTELNESIGPSKEYQWREGLMRMVLEGVTKQLDVVTTQEELKSLTKQQTAIVLQEVTKQLQIIENVVAQIPVDVLKSQQRKPGV
jgi:hypothetical protein